MQSRALSEARPSCFWLDRAERPEATPPLTSEVDADLAIVGGGFTGLWSALLALEEDPGRDVVLLESSRIGDKPVGDGAIGKTVAGAELQLVESAEHVQQHARQPRRTADHRRVLDGHQVKPPAPAGAIGGRAVLVATLADPVADGVVLLGGEGPLADA